MRQPGGLILCYHRVLPSLPPDPLGIENPWDGVVTVGRFRLHMEHLARHFSIIPFDELLARLADGSIRPGHATVTFDDGSEDNYLHAFPVLRHLGIPATIFLTTEPVERRRPFWWHRLGRRLYEARGDTLRVAEDFGIEAIDLRGAADVKRVYLRLWRTVREMPGPQRERVLAALGAMSAGDDARPLSWGQVREMLPAGITPGAHSHSHPSMVALSDEDLRGEILESRDLIEAGAGTLPRAFAYPFGHTDERVSRAVEAAGFLGAVTTREGLCGGGASRFLLPRITIGNWPVGFFRKYVEVIARTGVAMGPPAGALESALKSRLPLPILSAGALVRARLLRDGVTLTRYLRQYVASRSR